VFEEIISGIKSAEGQDKLAGGCRKSLQRVSGEGGD